MGHGGIFAGSIASVVWADNNQSPPDIGSWAMSRLRAELKARGQGCEQCMEKSEWVAKLRAHWNDPKTAAGSSGDNSEPSSSDEREPSPEEMKKMRDLVNESEEDFVKRSEATLKKQGLDPDTPLGDMTYEQFMQAMGGMGMGLGDNPEMRKQWYASVFFSVVRNVCASVQFRPCLCFCSVGIFRAGLLLWMSRDQIYANMQKQKKQNPESFTKKKSTKKPASKAPPPTPKPAPAPDFDHIEQAQVWHDDL